MTLLLWSWSHIPYILGIKSPLDGQTRKIEDTHGMYQYYLKIVPTKYRYLSGTFIWYITCSRLNKSYLTGEEIQTNQYSVTEHLRHLAINSGRYVNSYLRNFMDICQFNKVFRRGLPGVYFNYEVAPVQAVFEEKKKSLSRWCLNILIKF